MNAVAQAVHFPDIFPSFSEVGFRIQPKIKNAQKRRKPCFMRKIGMFASSATHDFPKKIMADSDIQLPNQKRKQQQSLNVREKLRFMQGLQDNWDGYGVAAPNAMAFRAADDILFALHESAITPTKIEPSVEEGITFSFVNNDKYVFLEIYNDGDIAVGYFEGDKDPIAYEFKDSFEQVNQAALKVCEFIDG